MISLCQEIEMRNVRERARCPWIRGQVERLNQTLKYMISSTCNSENIPFQCIKIYENLTFAYNDAIHGTTLLSLSKIFCLKVHKKDFILFITMK